MRLRFIPTIYHNVLRFLGTSSTREFQGCEIPFDQTHIEAYCHRLQVQYCIDGSRRMNDFYIEKIKFYKSRGTSKHEYLAAKVRAPNGTSFYLAFECGRSKIIRIGPPLTERNPSFNLHKVDGKVTPLGSSKKYKGNHVLLHTLSFPAPGPSTAAEPTASYSSHSASEPQPVPCHLYLYELAILVNTLHKMKSRYLLFSDKSYFYAGTIIKVLQEEYHPVVMVKTTGSRRLDRFWGLSVLDRKEKGKQMESKAGAWNNIEVYATGRVQMVPLKEKFQRALRDFQNPIRNNEAYWQAVDAQLKALKDEIANLKAENANLKAENVNLKAENANLKAENVRLKAEIANLKLQRSTSRAVVSATAVG